MAKFLALACVLVAFPLQANAETSITSAETDARRDAIHDTSFNWIYAGVCCSVFGIGAAAVVNPAPPAHRFLGKSPEYINLYTQTYQRARRDRQMTLAAMGSGGCCIGYLAVMFRFADSAPMRSPIP